MESKTNCDDDLGDMKKSYFKTSCFFANVLGLPGIKYVADLCIPSATKTGDGCPLGYKQPFGVENILHSVKVRSKHIVKTGMRKVLKSYPGKQTMRCLNKVLDISENLLASLGNGDDMRESDCDITQEEDEGIVDKEENIKIKSSTSTLMSKLPSVKSIVKIPIELWIALLKTFRRSVLLLAGKKDHFKSISTQKMYEIDSRKKLSPKKRLPMSCIHQLYRVLVQPFRSSTCYMGSMALQLGITSKGLSVGSPNRQDKLEKRKHDELSDDEEFYESGTEIFDLEDYDSEDDSDYEPSEHGSTDSLEYQEGDTESDLDLDEEIVDATVKSIPIKDSGKDCTKDSKLISLKPCANGTKDNKAVNIKHCVKEDSKIKVIKEDDKKKEEKDQVNKYTKTSEVPKDSKTEQVNKYTKISEVPKDSKTEQFPKKKKVPTATLR